MIEVAVLLLFSGLLFFLYVWFRLRLGNMKNKGGEEKWLRL